MVAVVVPPRYNSGSITFSWHWEPIEAEDSSKLDIMISDSVLSQNNSRYKIAVEKFSFLYPHKLECLEIKSISQSILTSQWLGDKPITELVYNWLWEDFRKISWVKDSFSFPRFPYW
jgi:hypothetical protein